MTIKTHRHHEHATGKGTRTYRIWMGMLARCRHASQPHYRRYGGSGVTVCNRWQTFQSFLADMGECPSEVHSIDRFPNRSGNYEPGNCRWATRQDQNQNTSKNRYLTLDGETLCAAEWARRLGISPQTIADRMRRGWTDEQVLSLDKGTRRGERSPAAKLTEGSVRQIRLRCKHGESKTDLAREFGVSDVTIYKIVSRQKWAHVP